MGCSVREAAVLTPGAGSGTSVPGLFQIWGLYVLQLLSCRSRVKAATGSQMLGVAAFQSNFT